MRPRFEDVYAGYLREGAEVAFLLTGDETVAVDIAHQALVRSLVSYRELRRPNDFDLWWYRDLFRIARRRERRRILRAKRLGPTGLRRAPFRVRGAVILDRLLGLTDDDAATILGCSPAAARAALQRGVALLGADGETDRLRAAVAGAALGSPSALPRSLHGRVRALRWLSAVAVTIILVASVGAVIWNPPRGVSTARPELPTQPFEPLEDTGLRVDRCADVSGAKVPGAKTIAKAERTAVRFGRALVRGKIGVVTALRDPAAEGLAFDEWARPGSGRGLRASGSRAATDDGVVAFACGRGIAARTWKVFVRDNSPISIKGLAIYYLVRRGDGWLVWASHKPGP